MFVFVKEIKGDNLHDVAGSSLWWLVLEIFYTDFKDLNVLNNSATGCEKALPMQEWLAWIHQSHSLLHSLLSHPNHKEMFMQQARLTQASEQGDSMTVRITVSVDVIIMLLSLPVPYSFKCIVFVSFFFFLNFLLFLYFGGGEGWDYFDHDSLFLSAQWPCCLPDWWTAGIPT